MILTSPALERVLKQTAKKAGDINQTGAVVHYGQVTGPPVQRSAVAGAGQGGASAGTSVLKVPVKVGGNSISQLCSFDDSYWPMIGDVVWLMQVGTSKKVKGHYIVGGRVAAGNQNAGNWPYTTNGSPRIVAATPAAGIEVNAGGVAVVYIDPYTQMGITSGLFRISWSIQFATATTGLYVAGYSWDNAVQEGNYLSGVQASTDLECSGITMTLTNDLWGLPYVVPWKQSSTNHLVQLNVNYDGVCYVAATIELLKAN